MKDELGKIGFMMAYSSRGDTAHHDREGVAVRKHATHVFQKQELEQEKKHQMRHLECLLINRKWSNRI